MPAALFPHWRKKRINGGSITTLLFLSLFFSSSFAWLEVLWCIAVRPSAIVIETGLCATVSLLLLLFFFFFFFWSRKEVLHSLSSSKYIYTVQYKQRPHTSQRVQHGGKRSSISWHDLNTKQNTAPGSRSFFIFILDSVYYTHSLLSLYIQSFTMPLLHADSRNINAMIFFFFPPKGKVKYCELHISRMWKFIKKNFLASLKITRLWFIYRLKM